jgi:hypothetical protein
MDIIFQQVRLVKQRCGERGQVEEVVLFSILMKNINSAGMTKIVKKVEKMIPPRTTLPRPL